MAQQTEQYGEIINDYELCIQFDNDEPVVLGTRDLDKTEDNQEVEITITNYILKNKQGHSIGFFDSKTKKEVKFFFRPITEDGLEKREESIKARENVMEIINNLKA